MDGKQQSTPTSVMAVKRKSQKDLRKGFVTHLRKLIVSLNNYSMKGNVIRICQKQWCILMIPALKKRVVRYLDVTHAEVTINAKCGDKYRYANQNCRGSRVAWLMGIQECNN